MAMSVDSSLKNEKDYNRMIHEFVCGYDCEAGLKLSKMVHDIIDSDSFYPNNKKDECKPTLFKCVVKPVYCPECGAEGRCIVDQDNMLTEYWAIKCKKCGHESVLKYDEVSYTMQ